MIGNEEIEKRFGFHKAAIEGPDATNETHADLRAAFKAFAKILDEAIPDGRYKYLAFTELEASSMWSHKAIAEKAPLVSE
jgi:hypothetical protein